MENTENHLSTQEPTKHEEALPQDMQEPEITPAQQKLPVWRWMVEGLRSAFFLTPRTDDIQPTPFQTAVLVLLSSLLIIGFERLKVQSPAEFLWDSWLLSWWTTPLFLWSCWLLLSSDLKARHSNSRKTKLSGLASWFVLISWLGIPINLLSYLPTITTVQGWLELFPTWEQSVFKGISIFVMIWALAAFTRLTAHYIATYWRIGIFTVLLIAISMAAWQFQRNYWWHDRWANETGVEEDRWQLTQKSFEQQQMLFQTQASELLPQRPGIIDVYGLVFAPYASEDVFWKESTMVADVLRTHFDTNGRILHLLNSRKTGDTLPWATPENLVRSIKALGERMDPAEDVLIVYMTSHGADSFELAANHWPLDVDPVTPSILRRALEDAGIKNQVLIISACYAGGWVKPLQSKHALIMTAADEKHTSYGCGSRSELTFFGRALFDEQLRTTHSFEKAFAQARIDIEKREQEAGKSDGFSNPQISLGEDIAPVLKKLETRLDNIKP